tara:strand:+ start:1701 stop:1976 length:276 start_codon:yes stop_codon:yes gene_type:complete
MAKYPIRFKIATPAGKVTGKAAAKPAAKAAAKPAAKAAQTRPAPPITQEALDRYARIQGEEARSDLLLRRGNPDVIRTTVNMRATPTKKDR